MLEREHTERDVDMNAAQRGNAIEQDRNAGETARKQVGGLNERLDQKCLKNGGIVTATAVMARRTM